MSGAELTARRSSRTLWSSASSYQTGLSSTTMPPSRQVHVAQERAKLLARAAKTAGRRPPRDRERRCDLGNRETVHLESNEHRARLALDALEQRVEELARALLVREIFRRGIGRAVAVEVGAEDLALRSASNAVDDPHGRRIKERPLAP